MVIIYFTFPALFHDFKAIGFYLNQPSPRQFVFTDVIGLLFCFSIRQAYLVTGSGVTVFHCSVGSFYHFTEYFRPGFKGILSLLQSLPDFRRLYFMFNA